MSSVGETYVTIRADTTQVAGDIKKGVGAAVKDTEKSLSQANRMAFDLQGRIQNLGPVIKSVGMVSASPSISSIGKNLAELEQLAVTYPHLAAGAAQARAQFDLLTQAEVKNVAATEAVAVANRRAARVPLATGLRSNLLNVGRQAESGAGLGQLAAFGVKAGVVGLAVTAAYQAVRQLQAGLRVTGEEASTTEGRFRNFGAALLGGDVIGSIKALRTELVLSAESLSKLQGEIAKGDTTNLKQLAAAAAAFGNSKLQQQLSQASFNVRANLQGDKAAQASLTPGLRDDLKVAKTAEREAQIGLRIFQQGTAEYSKAFQGYAQAVKERRAVQQQIEKNSTPATRDASRDARFQLNLLRAQQTKGTGNDKAILQGRRDYLQAQIANLEEEGATTDAAKSRLTGLYGQLKSVSGEITSLQEKSLADRQEKLLKSVSLQQTELQIQEAKARTDGQTITALQAESGLAAKLADDKRLDAQTRAGFALQAAQTDKQVFEINKAAAEEAKRNAKALADQREQERKEALAKLKQKREEATQLKELRLENAISAAGLTKATADDKKAIKAQIAYFKNLVSNTKGLEKEQARAQLIAARSRLKGLTDSGTTAGATTADFFKQAAQQFNEFGSNIAGRNGVLSGQDARGRFAGLALGAQQSPMTIVAAGINKLGALAQPQLTESQKQTRLLGQIAAGVRKFGAPAATADRIAIINARSKASNLGGQ